MTELHEGNLDGKFVGTMVVVLCEDSKTRYGLTEGGRRRKIYCMCPNCDHGERRHLETLMQRAADHGIREVLVRNPDHREMGTIRKFRMTEVAEYLGMIGEGICIDEKDS